MGTEEGGKPLRVGQGWGAGSVRQLCEETKNVLMEDIQDKGMIFTPEIDKL